jgi:hypothetical protein
MFICAKFLWRILNEKINFHNVVFLTAILPFVQTSTQGLTEVKGIEIQGISEGYEFINKNSFPVTIEAKVWRKQTKESYGIRQGDVYPAHIITTRVFVLATGAKFTWSLSDYYRSDSYLIFRAFKN